MEDNRVLNRSVSEKDDSAGRLSIMEQSPLFLERRSFGIEANEDLMGSMLDKKSESKQALQQTIK